MYMKKLAVTLSLTLSLPLLAGCGSILPEGRPAPRIYTLNAPAGTSDPVLLPHSLQVVLPQAAPGLDNERIALKKTDNRMDYFTDSKWAVPLPQTVQAVLVDALDDRFQSVSNDLTASNPDLMLQTELRDFQAEYRDNDSTPTIHIRIAAKWVKADTKTVIASKFYEQSLKAGSAEMADIILAFDKAAQTAIGMLMEDAKLVSVPVALPTVTKKP